MEAPSGETSDKLFPGALPVPGEAPAPGVGAVPSSSDSVCFTGACSDTIQKYYFKPERDSLKRKCGAHEILSCTMSDLHAFKVK